MEISKLVYSSVIQQDDHYPFGLTFNSYQRENSVQNRLKFQGREHVDDLGLNWDSFKWRNHQPDIGRFFNVDPISDKYYYNSPYAFSENKVIAHIELEGLEAKTIKQVSDRVTNKSNWQELGRGLKTYGNTLATMTGAKALWNKITEVEKSFPRQDKPLNEDMGGFVLTGTGMASHPLPDVRGQADDNSLVDLDASILDVPNFRGKIGELVTQIDNAGDIRDAAEGSGIAVWDATKDTQQQPAIEGDTLHYPIGEKEPFVGEQGQQTRKLSDSTSILIKKY